MFIPPKAICIFNTISIKILIVFFTEIDICVEPEMTPNSNKNLGKEQSWSKTFPDVKLYYKGIVIKTVWH